MTDIVKSSENVKESKRSTRRASSTGSGINPILQQLEQLIRSDDWINKEVKDYGENSQPPEFPKKRLF